MCGESRPWRWFLAGALVVTLISVVLGAPAASQTTVQTSDALAGAAGLRPFFAALAALQRHRTRRPLRIVQIGDSHTANDALSGRLRELLQARFGAGGRGWLPAGVPFKYYRPALVTVNESGWLHVKPSDAASGASFGLDASVAEPSEAGAGMTLKATNVGGFDRVAVEYVAKPDGAPLALRIDNGVLQIIATAARRAGPRLFEKLLPHPAHTVELVALQAGNQQVLGWDVERRGPGIVYENHGSIGATAALVTKLTPAAVSFELAERRPALLVVAFGTNEGFKDALDLSQYAAMFRDAVAGLRRAAPGAAVLVLGPPDGNRRPPGCAAETTADACDSHAACAWGEPRNLAAVRDIQRRIARRQGWAFWDWAAAMGGDCSIDRWLNEAPPLAMPDHVHLSKAGYEKIADALFSAVMTEYERWQRQRPARR